ncbi:3',5'-cyclic-AMP phosphodiesterase [Haemophilus paracuniculus]|uniref:3',5'-cyclic-AMP phosphodiesterase n=1 Tax=Haemophilus paracuniculus TaxID=734 RepID=A0A1T0AMD7_9PAST|nr:3',5'-cyclic-AMP phosphodiesterase [Haemophilus paracuniculus]OOR97001.1 3',5'-cyclic-AMP phosphodiesterase [Haemophilus paracuniculus]
MNALYQLDCQTSLRILHITDPHLFADPEQDLLGIKTCASFQAVLNQIQQSDFHYDLVLATGDLIQDEQKEAYHQFGKATKNLNKPLFWLEGNHDSQPEMTQVLSHYSHIQSAKQILAGNWQILLLDSHVQGKPYGELSEPQVVWLEQKLAENPQHYTLIALHHNLLPTHSKWLDQHSLKNQNAFAECLKKGNVKAILHGHIHQAVDQIWLDYRVLATPSTCIQFKPNCDEFTLDPIPQGWRELVLNPDGTIETIIKRLDGDYFLPNTAAKGY